MQQSTQSKQDTTKYLVYLAIALLFVNFILLFVPFLKVYQPSYKKTQFGVTTYEGWYTQSSPMISFIVPAFLPGIPYLCSISSVSASFRKKNNKNVFFKILNNSIEQPVKFVGLKLGAIANAMIMAIIYSIVKSEAETYAEAGAYCNMTAFGIINIICTVAFLVLLFILSNETKNMFTYVNKSERKDGAACAITENEREEIEE